MDTLFKGQMKKGRSFEKLSFLTFCLRITRNILLELLEFLGQFEHEVKNLTF